MIVVALPGAVGVVEVSVLLVSQLGSDLVEQSVVRVAIPVAVGAA